TLPKPRKRDSHACFPPRAGPSSVRRGAGCVRRSSSRHFLVRERSDRLGVGLASEGTPRPRLVLTLGRARFRALPLHGAGTVRAARDGWIATARVARGVPSRAMERETWRRGSRALPGWREALIAS